MFVVRLWKCHQKEKKGYLTHLCMPACKFSNANRNNALNGIIAFGEEVFHIKATLPPRGWMNELHPKLYAECQSREGLSRTSKSCGFMLIAQHRIRILHLIVPYNVSFWLLEKSRCLRLQSWYRYAVLKQRFKRENKDLYQLSKPTWCF